MSLETPKTDGIFEGAAYEAVQLGFEAKDRTERLVSLQILSQTSAAISLKRIADALTYQPGPHNLFDHIRELASK